MDTDEKMIGRGKALITAVLVAFINTSVGNTYILSINGFIKPPFLSSGDFYGSYVMYYRMWLLLIPLFSSLLLGMVLFEETAGTTFFGAISAAVITLVLSFLVLTWIPQMIGTIEFIGTSMVWSRELVLFVYMPTIPTTFGGAFIGSYLGGQFLPGETEGERRESMREIREWLNFLTIRARKKEREDEAELKNRDIDG
ncbi:MAG: hypothetical protein R6U61_05795 [Thermoplasmata archaeon]